MMNFTRLSWRKLPIAPLVALGVLSLATGGFWTCSAFPGDVATGPSSAVPAPAAPVKRASAKWKPIRKASAPRHSSAAAPRLDAWQVLGPGGGGAQYTPTISPHDPNLVLVSCDMSGAYLSNDGGNSWRMFNLAGGRIRFFVFDPKDPATIYAAAGTALWQSQDRGVSWSMIVPEAATARVIFGGDEGGLSLSGPPLWDSVAAMAVDPDDSNTLYAAFSSGLSISTNRGKTWTPPVKLSSGGALRVLVDPASPPQQRTVYIITRTEVCLFQNGQATGQGQPFGRPTWIEDSTAAFSPNGGPPIIYILLSHWFEGDAPIVHGGVLVSRDGGATWTEAHKTLLDSLENKWFLPSFATIAVPPGAPDSIYLSYNNLKPKGADNAWGFFGLAHSPDGGQTWDYPWQEKGAPAPNVKDAWLTERFGAAWGADPLGIGLTPGDPNLIYTTDWGRTMRSTDAGATWGPLYSKKLDDGSYTSTGLDVTACYSVYFDPFDNNRIFLSCIDIGLFRSDNGGDGWVSSSWGIDKNWTNTAYALAFDPAVPGRMWAAMNGHHELPRLFFIGNKDLTKVHGGILYSEDGGQTWVNSMGGLPEMAACDIIIDPSSPVDSRVLYAVGFSRGIYKSTDGGQNWVLKSTGIAGERPATWRVFLDPKGTLYAIVTRLSQDGKYGNEKDGALYKSTDGAETWSKMALPEGLNGPQGLAIDPTNPDRLYLAAWCRSDPVFGTCSSGGVYQSTDGGQNWAVAFSYDQYISDVSLDPAQPDVVYAAGWQSSIWRSSNRGADWSRIQGFNFKDANRVVPDPRNPSRIFVTTAGGGVWYGPAEGDPSAAEDMLTPPVRPRLNSTGPPKAARVIRKR